MGTFTVGYGFGMLAVGFAVILVIAIIAYKIINYEKKEDTYGK
jgi:hypothetical protein